MRGPQGQERPTDTVGCAVKVARLATGEMRLEMICQSRRNHRGSTKADLPGPRSSLPPSDRKSLGRRRPHGGARTASSTRPRGR